MLNSYVDSVIFVRELCGNFVKMKTYVRGVLIGC